MANDATAAPESERERLSQKDRVGEWRQVHLGEFLVIQMYLKTF